MRLNKLVARDLLDYSAPDTFLYPLSFAVNFWLASGTMIVTVLTTFFVESCLLGLLAYSMNS